MSVIAVLYSCLQYNVSSVTKLLFLNTACKVVFGWSK